MPGHIWHQYRSRRRRDRPVPRASGLLGLDSGVLGAWHHATSAEGYYAGLYKCFFSCRAKPEPAALASGIWSLLPDFSWKSGFSSEQHDFFSGPNRSQLRWQPEFGLIWYFLPGIPADCTTLLLWLVSASPKQSYATRTVATWRLQLLAVNWPMKWRKARTSSPLYKQVSLTARPCGLKQTHQLHVQSFYGTACPGNMTQIFPKKQLFG